VVTDNEGTPDEGEVGDHFSEDGRANTTEPPATTDQRTTGAPAHRANSSRSRMRVYLNGDLREVTGAATVSDVVAPGAESTPRGVAVAVDGTVIPRAQHATTTLHEGARIEVVTAVQGG